MLIASVGMASFSAQAFEVESKAEAIAFVVNTYFPLSEGGPNVFDEGTVRCTDCCTGQYKRSEIIIQGFIFQGTLNLDRGLLTTDPGYLSM
jgi:hypothetical protein